MTLALLVGSLVVNAALAWLLSMSISDSRKLRGKNDQQFAIINDLGRTIDGVRSIMGDDERDVN